MDNIGNRSGRDAIRCRAQTFQVLAEIDAYYRFDPNFRVYFQAKETREGGAPTTAEIRPSLDFHLMSMEQLREITAFDLDKAKSHVLLFSVGYRYLPTPGEPPNLATGPGSVGSNGFVTDTIGDFFGGPGTGPGEPFNMQLAAKVIF